MRKLILGFVMLAAAAAASAQEAAPAAGERNEWLPSFTRIAAEGPFDLTLVRVSDAEAPKIVYDTKGSYTTKFRAEVKDKVLHIRERSDSRRPDRTAVCVYYNDLASLSATDAAVSFADTLSQAMLDLTLSGLASLTGAMEVPDLDMNVTGHSAVCLTGSVRYLTLFVSGSKFNADGLEVMSARVNAQSNAEVRLWVTDRLEGRTSTGGVIRYKGTPGILRVSRKFMAGDIKPLE